ncbi:hypothetical protein DBR11_10685 [Pedobacter sp. HMWF019]|uniref:DUF5694 domain-containing protein n=1 Tax=Pedobacter sp. HMWF019 TaxID=2056856 RepID=UPI000D392C8B|nr:DUF5694 domain-containing protein [Pedobacter sp. HMWF019]PTT00149.1 hypothetical protein DBR11_10685 [Pedobacter sp. HMWF019]
MKSLIQTLFIFLFSIWTAQVSAQQTEVVVVGSSHENAPGSEDFNQVITKLKNFKPDMVFGEFLSPEDYAQLKSNQYGYESLKMAKDFVALKFPELSGDPAAKIKRANQKLAKFAYYHRLRMDLVGYYLKQSDIANARYQVFVLENYMKSAFGKQEQAYYAEKFGNRDSLIKARLYRSDSEYCTIYFPLIYALKQERIYSMDSQKHDTEWSKAWSLAAKAFKELEQKANRDTASAEAKTVAAITKYSEFTGNDMKMKSKSAYANMATDRYDELNDSWNFYGGRHFYGYPGFPDQHVKDMYIQWGFRNEDMCANVLRQLKEKKSKRVVVAVGAAHRKLMEDIMAKDPAIKIINYNELR